MKRPIQCEKKMSQIDVIPRWIDGKTGLHHKRSPDYAGNQRGGLQTREGINPPRRNQSYKDLMLQRHLT